MHVPDVPGCTVSAATVEEAVRRTPAAIALHLETASRKGEPLPPPKTLNEHKTAGRFGEDVRWDTVKVASAGRLSPRDFMRGRRPELYSDSATEREPVVDASFLRFTLAQVTERKDEVAFEHFCRKLAEREICPNLSPQTGPTGGGDSNVDTETHPVAERIAERWYVGDPERASKERWAFAFSAKQKWRPKVRDDIRKIAKTGRGYTVAYFISNQQVRDRDRGDMEDELREKWGLDVRIRDRNWIADRVLVKGYYELFESTLQISLGGTATRRLGRADAERERNLTELDRQIDDPDRYVGVGHQLAEDCLETALLARGLDRPRTDVDGRFDRAERIARKHGTDQQLLRITYHRAWTATWWYEDYAEFERLYEFAESLGLGTDNVWDLERVAILWQVGITWQRSRSVPEEDAQWGERTTELRCALKSIAEDGGRPTSSLMARTLLTIMMMTEEHSHEALASGLREIAGILETARDHLDYPFDSMARIVEELVNMTGGKEDLDGPLEKVIEIQAKRGGAVQEGRMRLKRALACEKAGRYAEVIAQAGKAQLLLGRGGADTEFLHSIFATGYAYEAMGLLWAARANYAFALHRIVLTSNTTGELPSSLYVPLARLIWLEIELGRVPQALCWLEFHRLALNAVDLTSRQIERLAEEVSLMDAVLAILVLRTPWSDLPKLDCAPGLLERLDLHVCRIAALFLLGYEEAVKYETGFDEPDKAFTKLLGQPAANDVAEHADWGVRWPFRLRTILFGCRIEVLVAKGRASLLLGETVLAFVESFLATSSIGSKQLSARPELCLEVVAKDDAKQPFEYELVEDDTGEVKIVISHARSPARIVDETYVRKTMELFAQLMAQLWMPMQPEDLESLFVEERAPDRASLTAQLPLVYEGVLGKEAKVEAKDWMALGTESMALRRSAPWRPAADPTPSRAEDSTKDTRRASPTSGVDAARHRDMKVLSVLNLPLWDSARWNGLGYTFARYPDDVPQMHFLFEDIEAGRKIFLGWLKRFGAVDQNETIGLTLITGVDRDYPDRYRLAVSHRETDLPDSNARFLGLSVRFHEMNPRDAHNLAQFLERYKRLGHYRIAPTDLRGAGRRVEIKQPEISIEKRLLKIVPAWTIGPDDFLRAALQGITNPVVPRGEEDPPFHQTSTGRFIELDDDG